MSRKATDPPGRLLSLIARDLEQRLGKDDDTRLPSVPGCDRSLNPSEISATACLTAVAARISGHPPRPAFAAACADALARHGDLVKRLDAIPTATARPSRADPFTELYETFLARSAPDQRTRRGVYCTPAPVARFIVRAVDRLLADDVGLSGGLAGLPAEARVLDPAAGTGVFLRAALEQSAEPESLAARLAGIELSPVALAMCAANLDHALSIRGAIGSWSAPLLLSGDALGEPESGGADLRRLRFSDPVPVVVGNPPYLGRSANRGLWIESLMRGRDRENDTCVADYTAYGGRPMGERNAKWLGDDYVKFLRAAQARIERTGWGAVGFVVNHGFLDGPTFRGMRESLCAAFDTLYVLDLHGNANRRERTPDGGADQNLFPIRQGVAIALMARRPGDHRRQARVRHAEIWGGRESKLDWLDARNIDTVPWEPVDPNPPLHLLQPRSRNTDRPEYDDAMGLDDIFPLQSLGIATARDRLAVRFTAAEMADTARLFGDMPEEKARETFAIGADGADWRVADAQADLRRHPEAAAHPVPLLYRPFDVRWTVYTGNARGFLCRPRRRIMDHIVGRDTPCLLFGRSVETPHGWAHVFGTRVIAQLHSVSLKEVNRVAPLYRIDAATGTRTANLSPAFIDAIASRYGLDWRNDDDSGPGFGAETVFGFLYALLHAPAYRRRYAEKLRHGIPRIPLLGGTDTFNTLAALGHTLFTLHTEPDRAIPAGRYQGPDDPVVGPIRVDGTRIHLNPEAAFHDIAPVITAYRVGDYPVARRWLSDRRGRVLNGDDRNRFLAILGAIAATLDIGTRIDDLLGDTLGDSGAGVPIRVSKTV